MFRSSQSCINFCVFFLWFKPFQPCERMKYSKAQPLVCGNLATFFVQLQFSVAFMNLNEDKREDP